MYWIMYWGYFHWIWVQYIGKKAKNVQSKDAFEYIFGYTCGNDVSARDWQKGDKSWWRANSSDTFSPLGPFIVNEINPENLEITGVINGEIVQKCNTSEMIWTIPKTIEFMIDGGEKINIPILIDEELILKKISNLLLLIR